MKTFWITFAFVVATSVPPAWAFGTMQEPPGVEAQGAQAPDAAQDTEPTPGAEAEQEEVAESEVIPRTGDGIVRMGSDYTVAAGERIRELVLMGGSATVEGQVDSDVVVMFGNATLREAASVGELVVMGGDVTIEPGAEVLGDLVLMGGSLDSPPGFAPGGEQVVFETFGFGTGFLELIPWVTRGLLWGRLIVPDLTWVWGVVGVFLFVYLGLNLVFDSATRACSTTISGRPLSTLLVGLLALLLAGPVTFLLTVSVVGLVVVPFFWSALLVAGLIGKVGVLRWMGSGVLRQDESDSRGLAALAVVVGFAIVTLAYMVPVLGILTWATLGFFGLGAAAIAFVGALRTENPTSTPGPLPMQPATIEPSVDPASAAGGPDVPAEGEAAGTAQTALDPALFPPATFLIRLGAFGLDFFLAVMTYGLLGLDGVGRFLLLFLIYNIGFWSWKGATVGGIICQFRVVRMDGQPLTFSDALVRGLSSIFSFAALGLGCLWVLWDAERQAWHDKIAGTYVVRVPRNWPLS